MTTLTIALMMMLIVSIMVFYSNKGIWLEQRSALNQYRSKQALNAAEAGLESALAVLNLTTGTPSRSSYLTFSTTTPGAFSIVAPSGSACALSGDTPHISASPTTVTQGIQSAYAVTFSLVGTSPDTSILIKSTGGSDCSALCTCSSKAVVSQVVKITPALLIPPDDTASVYGDFQMNGSGTITNLTGVGYPLKTKDTSIVLNGAAATGGITGTLTTGNCASTYASCSDYTTITTPDQFFASFFGDSALNIKEMANVVTSESSLSASTSGLVWFEGDLNLNGNVGSAANPVLLIVNGDMTILGNRDLYGYIYVIGNLTYNGNVTIRGAVGTGGDFRINGGGGTQNLTKDPDVLNKLKENAAVFTKMIGTWKDW